MNQQQNPENQWEVTYHYPGEVPEPEIWQSFASAFAFSQPNQDENEYWRYAQRADIQARFAAGENDIRVAWSAIAPNETYVVIRRI